ncbi:MAG: PAS domain S-box protein, partial [Rhodoferax sp.]
MRISTLVEHFARLDIGKAGAVTLRRLDDGAVLARVPAIQKPMQLAASTTEALRQSLGKDPQGALEVDQVSPVDGVARHYAFRTIGAFPFYVAVGLAQDDFLAQWKRDTGIVIGISALTLLILAWNFARLSQANASLTSEVSLRVRAETDLSETQRFIQSTLDALSAHICVLDADGLIVAVNQAWKRRYRTDNSMPGPYGIGAHYLAVCQSIDGPQGIYAAMVAQSLRSLAAAQSTSFEMEFPGTSPGAEQWFLLKITSFHSPLMHMVVVHDNITERRNQHQLQEQLLGDKRLALEGQRAAFQRVKLLTHAMEQCGESIVITDLIGRIEYVNLAYVRHSGYAYEELIGQSSRILKSGKTPPETYVSLWQTLLRGKIWQGEFFNRRKNATEYVEFATISPMLSEEGKVSHYVGVKLDITEQKRNAAELLAAK